jgi:hypothetical protein
MPSPFADSTTLCMRHCPFVFASDTRSTDGPIPALSFSSCPSGPMPSPLPNGSIYVHAVQCHAHCPSDTRLVRPRLPAHFPSYKAESSPSSSLTSNAESLYSWVLYHPLLILCICGWDPHTVRIERVLTHFTFRPSLNLLPYGASSSSFNLVHMWLGPPYCTN